MSRSETDVCNSALALLATERITVLADDDSVQAGLCRDLYPNARDEVLEAADWTFATKRVQLAASATSPVFGWNYKVLLPGDCFRVIGVWRDPEVDDRMKYVREGRYLLVDEVPAYVKYIFKLEDPSEFSALAVKAMYTNLAQKLCIPLTEDVKRSDKLAERVEFYLDDAAAVDGLQGSQERMQNSTFIKVR